MPPPPPLSGRATKKRFFSGFPKQVYILFCNYYKEEFSIILSVKLIYLVVFVVHLNSYYENQIMKEPLNQFTAHI